MYGGLFYAQTAYSLPAASEIDEIFSGWILIPGITDTSWDTVECP